MRTRRNQEKEQKATSPRGGLLAFRVLNALPYSSSVKDLYSRTKHSNDMFRVGLNLAESCAVRVSSPFVSKYVALDKFAASQIEKLEDRYGVDLVSKSVGAVAYPIGYSLGLAGFARDKVVGLTTPFVEYSYEVADAVIDQLLPPDYDESLSDEYRKMTTLQQKNPMRRIRERANMESIVALPSTTLVFSWNLFSSSLYLVTGFASMSLGRMLTSANSLINTINVQFEADLLHPWEAVSNGDLTKLYKAVLFHGIQNVNGMLDELEQQSLQLSHYLEDRNLPYNSQLFKFVAARLKSIERRLVRLGGVRLVVASENVSSPAKTPRRTVKPYLRITPRSTPSKRNSPDRTPSMMLGDGQIAWHERVHEEEHVQEEETHHEEHISQHKIEVLADRAPTMIWGSQKRRVSQVSKEEASPVKAAVVSKPKEVKEIPKPVASAPIKEATKAKEVSKETIKPVESTEVKEVAKPVVAAKPKVAKWPKVSKSEGKKFVKLAEANRQKELEAEEAAQAEAAAHKAEAKLPEHHEEVVEEKEEEEVDEHGYTLAKPPTHGHLLPQGVAKGIAKDICRARKHTPTPVNSPAEVLSNNPFGEILVDEEKAVAGPEFDEAQQAELRENALIALQKTLHAKTLHELLEQVGSTLERTERRAEENAQSGPWQTAKHAAHVEVVEPEVVVASPNVAENNPFGKLAEMDIDADPLSMGLSTM